MRHIRTMALFTLLICTLAMVRLACAPEVRNEETVDIVSGATGYGPAPPSEPDVFALSLPEATRLAAEVVALTVLRGGPQHLHRTEDDNVGTLSRVKMGQWTAADREYGFGSPASQWQYDQTAPDANKASAALAALLARRIISGAEAEPDEVTASELLLLWCEARQWLHPKESF